MCYGAGLRAFATEVRVQMREREAQLRGALEGGPGFSVPELPAGHHRHAIDVHDLHDVSDGHDTDKDGH
jgi:hypothetical protein